MTPNQLDLFTELEHRTWSPDEQLELPGRSCRPLASIRLAAVDGDGWIYATSVNLSDCGYGYPLARKWNRLAPTRAEAIGKASAEVSAWTDRYCAGSDESNHAKDQARQVRRWAAGLH